MHILTAKHTLFFCLILSFPHIHSLSLSLSLTHTHTHIHSYLKKFPLHCVLNSWTELNASTSTTPLLHIHPPSLLHIHTHSLLQITILSLSHTSAHASYNFSSIFSLFKHCNCDQCVQTYHSLYVCMILYIREWIIMHSIVTALSHNVPLLCWACQYYKVIYWIVHKLLTSCYVCSSIAT